MEKYEIVKQFDYALNGVFVKGKIVKNVISNIDEKYPYSWEISHYCAIDDEHDVYTPSNNFATTLENAEKALETYVKRFNNYKTIRDNDSY